MTVDINNKTAYNSGYNELAIIKILFKKMKN